MIIVPITHWGRETRICVSKRTIIGSDNGLTPGRRQAIIWTNDGILLIGPSGTNFSEILSKIHTFSVKKMHSKTSSAKWRPFCLGLNVIIVTEVVPRVPSGVILITYVHQTRIVPRWQPPGLAGTTQSVLTYWLMLVISSEGQASRKTQTPLDMV